MLQRVVPHSGLASTGATSAGCMSMRDLRPLPPPSPLLPAAFASPAPASVVGALEPPLAYQWRSFCASGRSGFT